MSADDPAHDRLGEPARAGAVLPQTGPCAAPLLADRVIRQIEAIDAWNAARRLREQALEAAASSRHERMDVTRRLAALRRTQDALAARSAQALAAESGLRRAPGPTAVLAHRHTWFMEKVALLLAERGVTVLGCTDNGAEALGVVVAEQPDVVLAGDRLAMMTGGTLLAETQVFAPRSLRAAHASDGQQAAALRAVAHSVFLHRHPPGFVVDGLVALHQSATQATTV